MVRLLALLDDIAATLDEVAAMSKVAMQKTSAIMTDDMAVNAAVVDGVSPDRELPMVKSIFLGSLINKFYCIAGVLALMAVFPPLIQVIMVIGGLYLSYEGVHKIVEKVFHSKESTKQKRRAVPEAEKVKGAIRTDLILSIEIIVIAKSTLSGDFVTQLLALIAVGIAASVVIYGLVAVIVKVDDFGLSLINSGYNSFGSLLVKSMPYLMKFLGIAGTIAMLLVGGGILSHTFHLPHYVNEHLQNCALGLVAGAVCLALLEVKAKFFPKQAAH
ncbi:MAG: DUF808 family protein [Pseudomonadota bacterium]